MLRRGTLVAIAAAAALVFAAAARPAAVAEIVAADGAILAQAGAGAGFGDAATGGWALRIDSATETRLDGVTLLGGRIYVRQLVVRPGAVTIRGLVVDGRPVRVRPNELIPLGGDGYAIVQQVAVVPGLGSGGRGVVGLRVVAGQSSTGLQPGTQVLVGLASAAAVAPAPRTGKATAAQLSLLTIGIDQTALASAGLVPILDPLAAPALGGTTGERAVLFARHLLGIRYVWGGASPLTGFDCSGLALYVYAQLGVRLTHYTGAQWYEGTRIPREALAPGDLVFFDPDASGAPQHEGIYAGGGEFIQAPHTGDVVRISSLDDPSFASRYLGAVRPY
jgi:cell wall-associated NlpC family hydrolase